MSELVGINKKRSGKDPRVALFELGFRPFFLAAAVSSVVSVAFWLFIYSLQIAPEMSPLRSSDWHAHEMIYGYSLAVIAGFLLTAIMNWTGVQTVHGGRLAALVSTWLLARILFLFGSRFLLLAGILDLTFAIGLITCISVPIFSTRSWKQIGIISKVFLLGLGNLCFYLGALGILEQGVYWAIYGAIYLIVSLILTIGGRVMPAFIQNAVDYNVQIISYRSILILNLLLLLGLFVNELFIQYSNLSGYLALALFILNSIRLISWHTPGIWKKPLLWSLFCAFIFINLGFLLFALSIFAGISKFLAIHAFAYGGIGLATLGMMARVSLGHTGRLISVPAIGTAWAFRVLLLGTVIRIFIPLVTSYHYILWMTVSQVCWILAFTIFIVGYARILIGPSADRL